MPFDDEQKNEIRGMLEEFGSDLLSKVDEKNSGLAASIKREIRAFESKIQEPPPKREPTNPSDPASKKLTLKTLEDKIESLTEQLAERDKKAQFAQLNTSIVSLAAEQKLRLPGDYASDMANYFGKDSFEQENGNWFVKSGEKTLTLKDAVSAFSQTEKGKLYVPVSVGGGSGDVRNKQRFTRSNDKVDLNEAYSNWASNPTYK